MSYFSVNLFYILLPSFQVLILVIVGFSVLPHLICNKSIQHLLALGPIDTHQHLLELIEHQARCLAPARSFVQWLSCLVTYIWSCYRLLYRISKLLLTCGILRLLLFLLYHRLTYPSIDFRTHRSYIPSGLHTWLCKGFCQWTVYIDVIGWLWMSHIKWPLLVVLIVIVLIGIHRWITLFRVNSERHLFNSTEVLHPV